MEREILTFLRMILSGLQDTTVPEPTNEDTARLGETERLERRGRGRERERERERDGRTCARLPLPSVFARQKSKKKRRRRRERKGRERRSGGKMLA